MVWDGDPDCWHEWDEFGRNGISGGTAGGMRARKGSDNFQIVQQQQQATCPRCGAWRGQLGQEPTPELYVKHLVDIFRQVRKVLRDDGTLWCNLGDSYISNNSDQVVQTLRTKGRLDASSTAVRPPKVPGLKSKDLVGIPWMVAFALRADGWYLRSDIIWHKSNSMPESVRDRPAKAHEYLFLLSKTSDYFYDYVAVMDHGSNKRSVWSVPTRSYKGAHFAVFPRKLIEPCVKAGTSEKGRCPKCGTPWTRKVRRLRKATRPGADSKIAGKDSAAVGNRDPGRHVTEITTKGWRPGCDCGLDPIPCVVLDPFGGSGTVAAVAKRLGRKAVSIELSKEYIKLQQDRMGRLYKGFFGTADVDD